MWCRLALALAVGFLLVSAAAVAAPGSPFEVTDFGAGVFAGDGEFDFSDRAAAEEKLLSVLADSAGTAKHLRAIQDYYRTFAATDEIVPRLRELLLTLRASTRVRAQVETAFVTGVLLNTDSSAARAVYLKDLVPLINTMRRDLLADPYAHLVIAMLFSAAPELKSNWFDEALYVFCYGYDEAEAMLAAGSYLLLMDLAYGGNNRLQWLIYLAMTRALELAPANAALRGRIKRLVAENLETPGYRPSKWLQSLNGS